MYLFNSIALILELELVAKLSGGLCQKHRWLSPTQGVSDSIDQSGT